MIGIELSIQEAIAVASSIKSNVIQVRRFLAEWDATWGKDNQIHRDHIETLKTAHREVFGKLQSVVVKPYITEIDDDPIDTLKF